MPAEDSAIWTDCFDDFDVGVGLVLIEGVYIADDFTAQMPQVVAVVNYCFSRHAAIDETLNEWCKYFEDALSVRDIFIESFPPFGPFLKARANIPDCFHLHFSG